MSATDSKEQVIRSLAAARRRGDFDEVKSLLADDIVWHELGDAAYSGDHRRADEVLSLSSCSRHRLLDRLIGGLKLPAKATDRVVTGSAPGRHLATGTAIKTA
jgi:ketosteroid isomerase-like protein